MKVKSLSRVQLLATPWTAAYQAPPSMGFSRQEYWSGVPLPSPIIITISMNFGKSLKETENSHWLQRVFGPVISMRKGCRIVNPGLDITVTNPSSSPRSLPNLKKLIQPLRDSVFPSSKWERWPYLTVLL